LTCGPAPIANRSSVAVAEIDTMRFGRRAIRTLPFAALTVTGKPGSAVVLAGFDESPQAAALSASATAMAATSRVFATKNLRVSGGVRSGGGAARTALPPRAVFVHRGAGDLARPRDGA
jgi:hypothetical protein